MNHVRVTTSQNVPIDYDVAGLGERMLAYLLDLAIFIVVFFFFVLVVSSLGLIFDGRGYLILLVLYGLLFVFYDLICEVFFNGQSVGKRVLKIKVISLDGTQPRLGQYLLRWLFRFVDFSITGMVGGVVAIALTPNKQRIGDVLAGTTVIRLVPRASFEALAFQPSSEEDEYQLRFPEAAELKDQDMVLIHEVIANFNRHGNEMLLHKMAEKVKELLQVRIPEEMNELQFLEEVVKDYTFLTTRE